MSIGIYLNGSIKSGIGHIVRITAIVNALPASEYKYIHFFGDDYANNILQKKLGDNDTVKIVNNNLKKNYDTVVIDSLDKAVITSALSNASQNYISLVHLPSYFRSAIKLLILRGKPRDLHGYNGTIITGPEFAVVDNNLAKYKRIHANNIKHGKIAILISGAFNSNFMLEMKKSLGNFSSSKELAEKILVPDKWAKDLKNKYRCFDHKEPWGICKEACLIITGTGLAAYEAAYLNIPCLYWCVNEQEWLVHTLQKHGYGKITTSEAKDTVKYALEMLLEIENGVKEYATSKIVDGKGAERIANVIMKNK